MVHDHAEEVDKEGFDGDVDANLVEAVHLRDESLGEEGHSC